MHIKSFLPVFFGLAFAALPVLADQYSFTMDHCSGGCGTAPFGTVNVTQDGTNTVKLSISLTSGDKFVSTGFPGSFGFNIVGNPSIGISNLTAGWSLLNTTASNLHFDGFGNLDYAVNCDVCGNGAGNPFAGPISFDITAAGLTPASFAELSRLPPGSEQTYFVADILGTTGNTGPVGATLTQTAVPEPGSISLLAAGALLLLFIGLRRNRNAAAEQA